MKQASVKFELLKGCFVHKVYNIIFFLAAKAGMITYTRSAGHPLEFKEHGVRFICLCPGAVNTEMQVITYYL